MLILNDDHPTRFQVGAWLHEHSAHVRFIHRYVPALWAAAQRHGIDPVGMVCQSAKETGYGHFSGAVLVRQNNTCGMRVDQRDLDDLQAAIDAHPANLGLRKLLHRLSHETFPSVHQGATAHAQHLLAYCRVPVAREYIVDPRWDEVWDTDWQPAVHWTDLNERWAVPGKRYGNDIEDMMAEVADQ